MVGCCMGAGARFFRYVRAKEKKDCFPLIFSCYLVSPFTFHSRYSGGEGEIKHGALVRAQCS